MVGVCKILFYKINQMKEKKWKITKKRGRILFIL